MLTLNKHVELGHMSWVGTDRDVAPRFEGREGRLHQASGVHHVVRSNCEGSEHVSLRGVRMEGDDSDGHRRALPLSAHSPQKMHCNQNQGWPVRAHYDEGCVRVRPCIPRAARKLLMPQTVR